jgi:hypothetical protein
MRQRALANHKAQRSHSARVTENDRLTSTPAGGLQRIFYAETVATNHPRHFRIKPANTIGPNDKIRRIEDMTSDEIQHRTISLRPAPAPLNRK